ncbi:MAG: class I SAM-dependent methyltransferase [Acidobacteriota bacterium]|nr:class I SAM-dependent methyltransferase [Acidobacteriota bacterium]
MKPDLDVAATLECEPELLRYLPEILQDFDALGSDPPRLIELLETQGVADEIRTGLDICSGKGATSIALAKRFGMHIDGIDAIGAFVESARAAATNAGVDELCRFTTGDLCAAVTRAGSYDLVVFSSVGPILGGITKTVAHLMMPLRSLGWILIEDSVLLPGAPVRPGFEAHAELDETRRRIEKSGAGIVAMCKFGSEAQRNDADMSRIVRRAAALVARRPDLADLVARYVERQREECDFLERWTQDVTWLLRKPNA